MTSRTWANGAAGNTPINANRLNGIEADLDLRVSKWQANEAVKAGSLRVSPNDDVVEALADFTTGMTYDPTNWKISTTFIKASTKGAANGVATLDSNGIVPTTQLPTGNNDFGYLVAVFGGNGTAMEKLNIYYSADGKTVVGGSNNPIYTDTNTGTSLRDPSVIKIGSTWFVAYTVNNGLSKTLGLIKSTDLLNWTQVGPIDVSSVPNIKQAWAPEFITDDNGDIYIFFSKIDLTTNNGSVYYIKATDPTGLTTWSAPTHMAWASEPTHYIDSTMVKQDGTWYQFYSTGSNILRATASSLTGTWTTDQTGDWLGIGTQVEAPELVKVNSTTWRLYYDPYGAGTGYRYKESTDLTTWTADVAVAKGPNFPPGQVLRHGSFIKLADSSSQNTVLGATFSSHKIFHAEFTGTTALPANATTEIGAGTYQASYSTDNAFVTVSNGRYTAVAAGLYSISIAQVVSGATGVSRSFVELRDPSNSALYWRGSGGAEDAFMVAIPNMRLNAGQTVQILTYVNYSGGSASVPFTVRITRISK